MSELVLGDALDALIDHRGKTPKKLGGDFTSSGTPVASAMLVREGRLALEDARFVSEEMYARWMSVPTRRHDVVLTSEAPLGRVALVQDDKPLVLGQRLFGLRGRAGVLDGRYLYYALQTDVVQNELHGRATGTTVTGIRQSELVRVRIPAPSYAMQQAIAEVLGALDDKIALNDRVASVSLALANAYFEHVAADLDSGPQTFGDFASVSGGGTPRTEVAEYWSGEIAWVIPSDVTALRSPYLFGTSRSITELGLEQCASRLFPAGSIFMTSRATIGAFAINQMPVAANQGFIVVVPPRAEARWWLFHEMSSRVDEMVQLANGSTFLELSRRNFKGMPVRLPSTSDLARFHEHVAPLHDRAAVSSHESAVLEQLREALLPRLMSGEIRVRDAEKAVEEAL